MVKEKESSKVSRRKFLTLGLGFGVGLLTGVSSGCEESSESEIVKFELVKEFDRIFGELKRHDATIPAEFKVASEELEERGFFPDIEPVSESYGFTSPYYPIYILQKNQTGERLLNVLDLHPLDSQFSEYAISEEQVVRKATTWVTTPRQSGFYRKPIEVVNVRNMRELTAQINADFDVWREEQ